MRTATHRAAIALNNTAVSLLIKGYTHDAVATLQEAVDLMFVATNERAYAQVDTHQEIQRALSQARGRGRLAQGESSHNGFLQEISSQLDPLQVYEVLTSPSRHPTSIGIMFPITIDPVHPEDDMATMVKYEASLVIYNFGIALYAVSTCSGLETPPLLIPHQHVRYGASALFQSYQSLRNAHYVLYTIHDPLDHTHELLQLVLGDALLNVCVLLNLRNSDFFELRQQMVILLQKAYARFRCFPRNDQRPAACA